ncbi:MAG: WYL domain-containing protein [Ornithinimicrobium sp.]
MAATSDPRASPAAAKTERLLNLVIALLYTKAPLSKSRIRGAVPQYQASGDEAFDRMFERDKDELRALGIPLRTQEIDPFFDDEAGYRIDRREYQLPEIEFAPDEVAVIGMASRAWSQASLAGPAAQAMRKLQAAGVEADEASVAGVEPLLHTTEPAFEAVRMATIAGRSIRFTYRATRAGTPGERHIQPWALTNWHGRWYVTGHDLDREAPRVFRLDRILSGVTVDRVSAATTYVVPPGHDPRAMITATYQDRPTTESDIPTRLRIRPGTAYSLRRRAESIVEGDHELGEWDLATFSDTAPQSLVADITAAGPDVVVIDPAEVRDAVRARWTAVLHAHLPPGEQVATSW